ncbi:uncharacterized protein BXIN_0257 [Babesia sp. Xinjiang]|uniref:uncharacterized protein n=1 Tax=Babesia sp. Xinjiang TaxID=462227 RepID=UPI000A261BB9|nr:uncharacterized protein BXIN_0257 [Babesia sp. Xinjiang]ORM39635.1 hypothetical protein BXIN_0257 [Babesia sp. Xinjiang]
MDPVTLLDSLESHASLSPKRGIEILDSGCNHVFSKRPLDDAIRLLYRPDAGVESSIETRFILKRARKDASKRFRDTLPFDREGVSAACPSANFCVAPRVGELLFLEDALDMLRTCIIKMPGFDKKEQLDALSLESDGVVSYFSQVVDIFLEYLDEQCVADLHIEGVPDMGECSEDESTVSLPDDTDRDSVGVILHCLILWCNWVFEMRSIAETALSLVHSSLDRCESQHVLDTAVRLKEANRNMVFYSSMCRTMSAALSERDSCMSHLVWDLVCEIQLLTQVERQADASAASPWQLISEQLSCGTIESNEIPSVVSDDPFHKNVQLLRNEMRVRINFKGECDALSRECDHYLQEQSSLNGRRLALVGRLEQLSKQLQELVTAHRIDTHIDSVKLPESKKLSPLLYHFLVRMQLLSLCRPSREILFKVMKYRDSDYCLHMSLLTPRDLLMPNSETASKAFPLQFIVSLDANGRLCVKEPLYPFSIPFLSRITSNSDVNSDKSEISNTSTSDDGSKDVDSCDTCGLGEFSLEDNDIPSAFCDRLEWWYRVAHQHIWNYHIVDGYRYNRLDVDFLLPCELTRGHVSRYEYKCGAWLLANECASIVMRLEFDESLKARCTFSDFDRKGRLQLDCDSPLIGRVSSKRECLNSENVCEVTLEYRILYIYVQFLESLYDEISHHFGSVSLIVNLALLMESYALIFDWLSSVDN